MISYHFLHSALILLALLAALGGVYLQSTNRKPLTYRTALLVAYRRTRTVVILLWLLAAALSGLFFFGPRA